MKYMYIKYKTDSMDTVIKDNNQIYYNHIETSHNSNLEKEHYCNKSNSREKNIDSSKVIDIKPHIQNKANTINEEITQFFFDSVHKNYLKKRKL